MMHLESQNIHPGIPNYQSEISNYTFGIHKLLLESQIMYFGIPHDASGIPHFSSRIQYCISPPLETKFFWVRITLVYTLYYTCNTLSWWWQPARALRNQYPDLDGKPQGQEIHLPDLVKMRQNTHNVKHAQRQSQGMCPLNFFPVGCDLHQCCHYNRGFKMVIKLLHATHHLTTQFKCNSFNPHMETPIFICLNPKPCMPTHDIQP